MTWHPRTRTTSSPPRSSNHSSHCSCPPGSPRPHDQLRVPFNSGLGSPKCHSSGVKGLATNKQNGSYVPRGFRRYLSRCADARWPSGHRGSSSQGTTCRANTYTLVHSHAHFLSGPPHPLLPMYATSLAHPASRLIPMWSRCSPSYTTPPMFSPLLDGYGHHIVHLRRFYSTARWCLSAPLRRPPSAGYQASIGEHRQADGLFRPLSPSHVSPSSYSGMLDVTAPSPPSFEPFVTRPLLRLGSPAVVPGP